MNRPNSRFCGLLLLACQLALAGCANHLYKIYDYEIETVTLPFGNLYIESKGTDKTISREPDVTEVGDPIFFRLVVLTGGEPGQPISISVLNAEALEIVRTFGLSGVTDPNASFMSLDKTRTTGLQAGIRIITRHEPITLELEIIFKSEVSRVVVELDPRYREEWQGGLMSIVESV